MIYIFNSAYRPLYATNVLVTLFLPSGYVNQYRYGYESYVNPALLEKLNKKVIRDSERVLVVFIDRSQGQSKEYTFYPLRSGYLTQHNKEGGQLFLEVKMDEYLAPTKIETFNEKLKHELDRFGLPRKNEKNPEDDGYYAIYAEYDIRNNENLFVYGDEAWAKTVDLVSEQGVFKGKKVVFAKTKLKATYGSEEIVEPVLRNKRPVYRLLRNKMYDLNILYRFPIQRSDTNSKAILDISLDSPMQALSNTEFSIDGVSDNLKFRFASKAHPEEKRGNIHFVFKDSADTSQSNNVAIGPEADLFVEIKEGMRFWICVFAALSIWALGGGLAGMSFAKMEIHCISQLIPELWSNTGFLLKLFGNILQAISLGWLFILIGKKLI